jgi:ATP-dependent exoDNAse (exonuclease V) alpha subunit
VTFTDFFIKIGALATFRRLERMAASHQPVIVSHHPILRYVEKFGTIFAIGDKVMQIENDYDKEIYNGDIGYIEAIDLDRSEMMIDFHGRPTTYAFGELDQVGPRLRNAHP